MRTLTIAAFAALLVAVAAPAARAQDAEDVEITRMAKEHYRLGQDAFKAAKYPDAIRELKKAYLLKRLPALLVNIARTYDKLGDLDNEIYYYKKYLAEAPPEAKDREAVKQSLTDAEQRKAGKPAPGAEESPAATVPTASPGEAQPRATRKRPPPPTHEEQPSETAPPSESAPPAETPRTTRKRPPPAETPPEPSEPPSATPAPREWSHTPIDAAPPNQPIDVRVTLPVMKGVKVWLNYRGKGQAEFTTVEMKRHGAEKVGRIPAEDVQGKSLQYYIEAKDKTGAVIKNSGTQSDPNIVLLDPTAQPQTLLYRPHASGAEAAAERGEEESSTEPRREETTAPPPPAEETPPPRVHNPDEEQAPLGPRSSENERPPAGPHATAPRETTAPGWKPGLLGKLGFGLLGGGVGIAIVGGAVGGYYARAFSTAVKNDACLPGEVCPGTPPTDQSDPCGTANKPYIFDDPQCPANDKSFQDKGKIASAVGIASLAGGFAIAGAGAALVIVDYVKHKPKSAPPPRRHRRRARPAAPPPLEEGAPPPEGGAPPPGDGAPPPPPGDGAPPPDAPPPPEGGEPPSSSLVPPPAIQHITATPIVTGKSVGLGFGFQF